MPTKGCLRPDGSPCTYARHSLLTHPFQQLVGHFLGLQLLEELLAKLLEAGEPELGGQLGAAEVLRPAAVQGDVEVESGRRLRGCLKMRLLKMCSKFLIRAVTIPHNCEL